MTHRARITTELLRSYQRLVSPGLGSRCRFHPSCSEYALQAVRRFGSGRGIYLGVRRVLRCHPLREGGVDEVPERFAWRVGTQVRT